MAIEWQEHFMILVMGHGLPLLLLSIFLQDAPPANVWKVSTWVWWEDHSPALSNLHHRQVFAKASKALPYGVRDFNLLTSLQSTIVPVSGLNLFCYKIVYCSEYPSAMCLWTKINWQIYVCIQSSPFSSHWKKISDQLNWLPFNKPWRYI